MREALRRTLGGIGRTLITVGLLILAFVAYQLWGTGWFTAREQSSLTKRFHRELAQERATAPVPTAGPTTTARGATTSPPPTTAAPVRPSDDAIARILRDVKEGDPIGIIHLPWSDYAIVQGTSRDDLKKGPGHYLDTPYPGQLGNAAIAGHRTTYLHPFSSLDTLQVGQTFTIDMLWGRYTYRVMTPPTPVLPSDVYVAETGAPTKGPKLDHPDRRPADQGWLTLTTCHPKFSASHRLIVQAELVVAKSPKPVRYSPPTSVAHEGGGQQAIANDLGLGGDRGSRTPAVACGIIVALIGTLWWWVYRHWRHPATWLAGAVVFLPFLVVFYVYLERVLPSGY